MARDRIVLSIAGGFLMCALLAFSSAWDKKREVGQASGQKEAGRQAQISYIA